MKDQHTAFSGSIPANYDRYLGPMFFQPYAEDLAARLQVPDNSSVLELAAGTGIVTRVLRDRLPASAKLTATDLNGPMLDHAKTRFRENEAVEWQQADACSLPFVDGMFDAVVCQFGMMFVPDKLLAMQEAHRVLKPGGVFLFNVWDAIEQNALSLLAHRTIASHFEKDPPTFYQIPFGYYDQQEIKRVLQEAGFREIKIEAVAKVSQAGRAEDAAMGLVQGSPVAVAIAERDASLLPAITNSVAKKIGEQFGETNVRASMRAIVVEARA